jgi:hypothetical protein
MHNVNDYPASAADPKTCIQCSACAPWGGTRKKIAGRVLDGRTWELDAGEARCVFSVLFPDGLIYRTTDGVRRIEGPASMPTVHERGRTSALPD